MAETNDAADVRRRALVRESKWPYWSLLSLAWVAWLHLAIRTRERRYFIFAFLWAIPFFTLAVVEPGQNGQMYAWVQMLIMSMYFGGIVHVFRERRKAALRLDEMPALALVKQPGVMQVAAGVREESPAQGATPAPEPAPTAPAISAPAQPETKKPGWGERWQDFKADVRIERRRMKTGIEPGDDWASAAMIPIVPCVEEADDDDEVTPPWVRRGWLGRLFMLLFSWLVNRQFYSAISIFDDYFYVTQSSNRLGLLFRKTRIDVVRRHNKTDILRLVVAPYRKEAMAYASMYDSTYTTRKMSGEVFRLYVRPEATDGGRTLLKYVFRVSNDVSTPEISLNEALTELDRLVPPERRASLPTPSGRRAKITSAHRLQARGS